jgi:hypothetical protein
MEDAFGTVEVIDYPIISDSQAISGCSRHTMVRVAVKIETKPVNGSFDTRPDFDGQFEKSSVKIARIDLLGGRQLPGCGWRMRE